MGSNVPLGRPSLPARERRSAGFRVRFRKDEAEDVQKAAEVLEMSVAAFMREVVLKRTHSVLLAERLAVQEAALEGQRTRAAREAKLAASLDQGSTCES